MWLHSKRVSRPQNVPAETNGRCPCCFVIGMYCQRCTLIKLANLSFKAVVGGNNILSQNFSYFSILLPRIAPPKRSHEMTYTSWWLIIINLSFK